MEILIWILPFLSFILFICGYFSYKKKQKEIYQTEKLEREQQLNSELSNLIRQVDTSTFKLSQIEKEIKDKEHFNETLLKAREEEMERLLQAKKSEVDKELEIYYKYKKLENNKEIEKLNKEIIEYKEAYNRTINDFTQRQAAINEAIQREKEIHENENFYKIQISEQDIEDINVLREIEPKLRNREILNKLIFTSFIQRPLQEMEKRVLGGEKFSGIYKITYLKTGEAYIGKSTDILGRWVEHVKSSLDIGSIAHSSFHTRLAKDGLWNYSFEVLEKVPKERLSEREKYYIELYQTDKIGLNMKAGG